MKNFWNLTKIEVHFSIKMSFCSFQRNKKQRESVKMTKFSHATRKKTSFSYMSTRNFTLVLERSSSWIDIDFYVELTPGIVLQVLLLWVSLFSVSSVELCFAFQLTNQTRMKQTRKRDKKISKNLSSLMPGHIVQNLNAKIKHTLIDRKCTKFRFTIEILFILWLPLFERL